MSKRPITISLEPWPYEGRPRVLIEHPDPDQALEIAGAVRRAGCTVGICRGPDAAPASTTRCPLHGLEPCVAVEGADVVVTALDLSAPGGSDVVRGLRTRYRDTPALVLATVEQTLALDDALDGCTVLPIDAKPEDVATTVRKLLDDAALRTTARR